MNFIDCHVKFIFLSLNFLHFQHPIHPFRVELGTKLAVEIESGFIPFQHLPVWEHFF